MKKILFIAFMLCAVAFATAQPRAIGARFGWNAEFSYQHALNKNFIELDAGIVGWGRGIVVNGVYDFIIATPQWTPKGEWNFYAGPGLGLGYRWDDYHHNYYYTSSAGIAGVVGQFGLEYTFDFGLSLSADYRPFIGIAFGKYAGNGFNDRGEWKKVRFYKEGLWDLAISVRYRF